MIGQEAVGRSVGPNDGQLVFNNMALRLKAALAGLGLAYVPEDQVEEHLNDGRLIRVLDDWCQCTARGC